MGQPWHVGVLARGGFQPHLGGHGHELWIHNWMPLSEIRQEWIGREVEGDGLVAPLWGADKIPHAASNLGEALDPHDLQHHTKTCKEIALGYKCHN